MTAAFASDTFIFTPAAGTGGSLSPTTAQTVSYNGTTSFAVIPAAGYHVVSVEGCRGTLSGSTFTTGPATADCTVNATFALDTFTVTPSAGAGGEHQSEQRPGREL